MGSLVVGTAVAQTQPLPNATSGVAGSFSKGVVYIQASGSGSGTWSAIFNVAPISPSGVVGTPRQFTVSNSAPMIDMDVQTGASIFAGWWTNPVGSVSYMLGSVDG